MYTKYPAQVDSSNELPLAEDNKTPVKAEVVNRLREAILAIETELGADPSREFGTVRARLDAMETGTGSGSIELREDGDLVASSVTSINFTGGATLTQTSPVQVEVAIVGGQATQIQQNVSVANNQTSFTLSNTPIQFSAVQMFVNGLKQTYGDDYTVSGTTVTYAGIPLITTDIVEFWYLEDLGGISEGSGSLTIQNDGVDIETAVTSINFVLPTIVSSTGDGTVDVIGIPDPLNIDTLNVGTELNVSGPLTMVNGDIFDSSGNDQQYLATSHIFNSTAAFEAHGPSGIYLDSSAGGFEVRTGGTVLTDLGSGDIRLRGTDGYFQIGVGSYAAQIVANTIELTGTLTNNGSPITTTTDEITDGTGTLGFLGVAGALSTTGITTLSLAATTSVGLQIGSSIQSHTISGANRSIVTPNAAGTTSQTELFNNTLCTTTYAGAYSLTAGGAVTIGGSGLTQLQPTANVNCSITAQDSTAYIYVNNGSANIVSSVNFIASAFATSITGTSTLTLVGGSITANSARIDRFDAQALSSSTSSAALHKYERISTAVTTLNLPSISVTDANSAIIVIRAAGGGTCAVTRADSDTIDGATTYTMDDTVPQAMFVVNAAGDGWEAFPRA